MFVFCDHECCYWFTFNKSRNVHVKNLPQSLLVKYFDFFTKTFFPKLTVQLICECGLSAGVCGMYVSEILREIISLKETSFWHIGSGR